MKDREILEKYLKIMQNDAHRNAVKRAMFEGKTEIEIIKSEEQKAIENILKENENLKQASIINDSLYKEVCNKNKELEAQNNIYKKYAVMTTKEGIIIAGVKFSFEDYIPKALIKEIRDKAEFEDYYTLPNVIDDLNEILGDEK